MRSTGNQPNATAPLHIRRHEYATPPHGSHLRLQDVRPPLTRYVQSLLRDKDPSYPSLASFTRPTSCTKSATPCADAIIEDAK